MKKVLVMAAAAALCAGMLSGCGASGDNSNSNSNGGSNTAAEQTNDVAMSYKTVDELKADLDNEDVVVVDVRKAEDFAAGHIKGAVSADMDAAKAGDAAAGEANMKAALKEATGDEKGAGKELVLVCYSGKSYAQAGTNVLNTIGADMDKVKTLEGGIQAWGDEDLEK